MALLSTTELNLSINDEGIGFVEKEPGMSEIGSYGEVRLPKGVIKNGYIQEPEILLDKLSTVLKNFKIKAKTIRWVLSEQNAILRVLKISKQELSGKSVGEYIKSQIGKTIHFPFKAPIYNHFIKDETDEEYNVILYILDEFMLHDYMDIFDRLKLKNVQYEMPALALLRLYYLEDEKESFDDDDDYSRKGKKMAEVDEEDLVDGLMIFQLYDTMFSITIFENEYPVFSMMDDIDLPEKIYDTAEQYIFRIANYYKFNMNDGKKAIKDVAVFNLTSVATNDQLLEELDMRLKGLKYEIFDMEKKSDYYKKILPTGCYISLASSLYK